MSQYRFITSLSLMFALSYLFAETTVKFTPPELQPGMAGLEAMLESSAEDFNDDISTLIDKSLDKPQFMQGFAGAASIAVLIPFSPHTTAQRKIAVGSAASVYAENLSPKSADQFQSLTPESDIKAGACIQPLVVNVIFPLDRIHQGLTGGASVGFMDAEAGNYGVWAFSAGLSASYLFFKSGKGIVTWDGISASAGMDFAMNRLTTVIEPGSISQTVPIDGDGNGPLVPFFVTLNIDPTIRAGIETKLFSLKVQATTGVTFFRTVTVFAGGGLSASYAREGISVQMNEEIEVEGYLADLVVKNGTISITGTTAEHDIISGNAFALAGMKFSVGSFEISIPVVWKPMDSLGFGVFMGVRF